MTDLVQAAAWHRQAAAIAAAAARTGVRHNDLARVRERLLTQQGRFAEVAERAGVALPSLVPSQQEVTTAAPMLGDHSIEAVSAALRTAASTLDAADGALTTMAADPASVVSTVPATPAPSRPSVPERAEPASEEPGTNLPVAARNGIVYGLYAIGMLGWQLPYLVWVAESKVFPTIVDLLVLPVVAWALGWLTIGWADRKANRTPRLGFAICVAADLLLCGGVVTLVG